MRTSDENGRISRPQRAHASATAKTRAAKTDPANATGKTDPVTRVATTETDRTAAATNHQQGERRNGHVEHEGGEMEVTAPERQPEHRQGCIPDQLEMPVLPSLALCRGALGPRPEIRS